MPAIHDAIGAKEGELSAVDIAMYKERLRSDSDASVRNESLRASRSAPLTRGPVQVLEGIRFFRNRLSVDVSPPREADASAPLKRASYDRSYRAVRPVVEAGLLPEFVRLLDKHKNTTIRFEAAWCLTNVAGGNSEMTRAVVDAGALPIVASLITLENALSADEATVSLCEQCVWAAGNICGDGVTMRNLVITAGVPRRLAEIFTQADAISEKPFGGIPVTMLRNAAWTALNVFIGKPKPAYIAPLAELLCAIAGLVTVDDDEVCA